jgi:hypothetical protein
MNRGKTGELLELQLRKNGTTNARDLEGGKNIEKTRMDDSMKT